MEQQYALTFNSILTISAGSFNGDSGTIHINNNFLLTGSGHLRRHRNAFSPIGSFGDMADTRLSRTTMGP